MSRGNNSTSPAKTDKESIAKMANTISFAALFYPMLWPLANPWLLMEIDGWSFLKGRNAVFAARVSTGVEFWRLIGWKRQIIKANQLLTELSSINGTKKVYEKLFRRCLWEPLARRLDEGGAQITDYDLKTLEKKPFPDSVFAVPTYCNVAKPTNCPLTSVCGRLRQESSKSLQTNWAYDQ